jgi:predicted phage-related endonuclease
MIEIIQISPEFKDWIEKIDKSIKDLQERQLELTGLFVQHSQAVIDNFTITNKRLEKIESDSKRIDSDLTALYEMTAEAAQAHSQCFESTLQNLEILASRVAQLEDETIER